MSTTGAAGTRDEDATVEWPVEWTPVEGTRDGVLARIEYGAMRAATWSLAHAPGFVRRPLVELLCRFARRFDRQHADAARVFLRQALGELSRAELEARVLQAYRHLFRVSIESERWSREVTDENWRERLELDLSPEFEALRGKGALVICPHVGDWEAGVSFMPRLGFRPFYAVARPPKNRPLSRHLQRTRESRGIRTLPRRGAMKYAGEVVGGGGCLGLLIDQRARNRAVLVPFFGRPAPCDRSAGVLIKRLRVPIAIGAVYHTDRPFHYRLVGHTVISPEEVSGLSVEEIIARLNAELEERILEAPEQYFWLHDRYRGAPEAGAGE